MWSGIARWALGLAAITLACSPDSPTDPLRAPGELHPSALVQPAGTRRTMTIDGEIADWEGVAPLLVNDAAIDVRSVRVANDGAFVYFLIEDVSTARPFVFVLMDADRDTATGCRIGWDTTRLGMEGGFWAGQYIDGPQVSVFQYGMNDDCGGPGIADYATIALDSPYIELAVPIADLRRLGVERAFDFVMQGSRYGHTGKASYGIVGWPAPDLPPQPSERPCADSAHQGVQGGDCALVSLLRDPGYFGITPGEATDAQMLAYLGRNRTNVALLLAQVDFGRAVQAYLADSSRTSLEDGEFFRQAGNATDPAALLHYLAVWAGFWDAVTYYALNHDADVISGLRPDLAPYRAGIIDPAVAATRAIVQTYFAVRHAQYFWIPDPAAAFAAVTGKYGEQAVRGIAARAKVQPEQISGWLESAYVSYLLVGYPESNGIRRVQGRAVAGTIVKAEE